MKSKIYKSTTVGLILMNSPAIVSADATGNYQGVINGIFDSGCSEGGVSTPLDVTLQITEDNGSSTSGSLNIQSSPPLNSQVNGTSGTVFTLDFNDAFGTESFDVEILSNGDLEIDNLDFDADGYGGGCYFSYSGILTSTGSGGIINPEEAAGTQLTNNTNLRSDVNAISGPISGHLNKTMQGDAKGGSVTQQGFLIEGEGGLNAGDMQWGNVGAWLSYNFTTTENDFVRTAFESDRHVVVGGLDFSPNDIAVIGLAFAYENGEIDTTFNGGKIESDGITIAPYVGLLLSETWSLDASFGWSFIENDQFRTAAGNRITSNPDTDRFFFSGNFNGITYHDNWIFGGRVGYMYARTSTDTFTEVGVGANTVAKNSATLGQLRIGGDAAYSIGNWEPFVSAMYQYDVSFEEITLTPGAQPDNDRDDILFGTGFRYFSDNGLTANFEYNKRLFRNQFDEDSWTATVRWDF